MTPVKLHESNEFKVIVFIYEIRQIPSTMVIKCFLV